MAKTTTRVANYGKKYKQALIDLLQDTTVSITIPDEVTTLGAERWKNDTQLQYIDFNKVEVIPSYTCYNCSILTQAVFSIHTTQIGDYAFYHCQKFEDTELPHTLTNIGQWAFYNAGSSYPRGTHTFTMIDDVGVHTIIGAYAFNNSHLSEIRAYVNDIGNYAFENCSSLTDVDIEIHGSLGSYVFSGCSYIKIFEINANSVITSLGNNVFYNLAVNTSAAFRNISPFDFRNSTFTSVGGNVWYNNQYDGMVYFPSTLATITGNFLNGATGNWKLYFSSIPTVSSSSYLRSDASNFTVKYFFPYDLLSDATVATNWSSHTSQMIGYGTGFEAGTVLPLYVQGSGVGITWYDDETLTNVVTTSSGPTAIYYCTLGSTRLVWFVGTPQCVDASITISDGVNTYFAGDPVLVGTSVTVTPSYTDPSKDQLFLFKVNGADYTSVGTASITMDQDLSVIAMYWDGVHQPFMPNLADNDWSMIQMASKLGTIPSTWAVGDEKTATWNGQNYLARLVDKTGKFTRVADGSTAYLCFEFENFLPYYMAYNSNNSNVVANSPLLASMNSGDIWDKLDPDLKAVLEDVNVLVSPQGSGSPAPTNHAFKLFLPREGDLFSARGYSVQSEFDAITQDEYYQAHNTNNDRRKAKLATPTSYYYYWELSPYSGDSIYVCIVTGSGYASYGVSGGSNGVAPRFAL